MSADTPTGPRPLETPEATGDRRADALRRLLAVVDRLREPEAGCPWDLEQTLRSFAPSAIEEAHELVEAVEAGDDEAVVEEAGDVLLVVALLARIGEDEARFDVARVADAVADKLVRRHPHVFGGANVEGADGAIASWERIKAEERKAKPRADASRLAGVPATLPALQRIGRIGAKAIAAGFRWPEDSGAFRKLREEVEELDEALEGAGGAPGRDERVAAELGDVLLAAGLMGAYLGIDPEQAARDALRRFEGRFRAMERELGDDFGAAGIDTLAAAWRRAKAGE